MSWLKYQHNKMLELKQLDTYRALIEDAAKDTVLWLQANPSAEERVHLLGIQDGLAGLASIITRRMELCGEVRDDWVWSETVDEVKSRLDKAREARGNIMGKGLARIAERLPRELPGSQVRLGYNDDGGEYAAGQQNKQPWPTPEESKFTNAALPTSLGVQQKEKGAAGPAPEQPQKVGSVGDPEVAKRRSLVRANPDISAQEMCEIFDRQHVPLPSKWQAAGFSSWASAYKNSNYRRRISVLISKDRQTA
jgi:hypothetical protein